MAGLPKKARLLNKADYNAVFNKSVKISDCFFLILIQKNSNPNNRLGLVISKKVDKRAVQRNRIKRLIRESFRNTTFDIACDYVILARSNASKSNNKVLLNSLNNLWKRSQSKIKQLRKK